MQESLRPLLELPGVERAVRAARVAIDEVHRIPVNRRGWAVTAAEASVRAARASAAVAGATAMMPHGAEVTDASLKGALRVAEALGPLLATWQRAPLQALARLHVLAAADLVGPDSARLGRPVAGDAISARLDMMARLVVEWGTDARDTIPGPVQTAIVHGELLTLAPFGIADGVVARAAARLTMIGSGLDPKGLVVPEVAYFRARREYADAAAGFASGQPERVGAWIVFCCRALERGASEARSIAGAAG